MVSKTIKFLVSTDDAFFEYAPLAKWRSYSCGDFLRFLRSCLCHIDDSFGAPWGEKQMILVESSGEKYFDLEFGPEFDLGIIQSGYPNKGVLIYLKMKPYLQCRIRVTHSRNALQTLQNSNLIQFPAIGTATVIPDFTPSKFANDPLWTTSSLRVQGNDNHYIAQGNLGIGTTTHHKTQPIRWSRENFADTTAYLSHNKN